MDFRRRAGFKLTGNRLKLREAYGIPAVLPKPRGRQFPAGIPKGNMWEREKKVRTPRGLQKGLKVAEILAGVGAQ